MPVTGYDQIEYGSLTDVGVRRTHNQDAYVVITASDLDNWMHQGHVFLVADGMGGHAVGELASELAVRYIPHTYLKHSHEGAVPALRKAFLETNFLIHDKGQQNREFAGMGTTTSALVLRPEGAWIGHVGDSRVYRIRGQQIEQLSFDHSLLWELARNHKVSPESLEDSIPSNRIVRSLGPEPLVEVDIEGPHPVLPGDIYVLCSDGLSGPLSDSEIGSIASALPPAEACQLLIDLANLKGGPDNITVLIVRVGATQQTQPTNGRPLPSLDKNQPSWLQRIPWPLVVLGVGVVLAVIAVYLAIDRGPSAIALTILVVAVLTTGAGAGWLVVSAIREKKNPPPPTYKPRIRIYRQAPCAIDRAIVVKLAKGEAALRQRIRAHNWEADWKACDQLRQQAETQAQQGDLTGAFRCYCRTLRVLTSAYHRQRGKEEPCEPLWEEDKDNPEGAPPA